MSLGEYIGQSRVRTSSRISLGGLDRDILAEKVATSLRKGAAVKEAAAKHGISTTMVRNLAADYDFPLPSLKGEKNWPAKDDPGLREDTSYSWARANWERSVRAARDTARLERLQLRPVYIPPTSEEIKANAAQRVAWGTYPPPVIYDEYIAPPPRPSRGGSKSKLSAQQIISEVCFKHEVSHRELIGDMRPRRITNARAEAYFRLREERQLSWSQIGKLMGGKDHTTTYHGYQKHLERLMLAGSEADAG